MGIRLVGLTKEHKKLIREAEAAGGRVVKKARGLMIHGPKGAAMLHMTPSDNRAIPNARADLRRAGLEV